MGLLSNIFKLGEIKLDKNYCMTTKEMKNIDPSLFPNVFPIWNTDENCLYMLYRQDNGKTKLECFKEMEWLDDPVVLYPIIDENGKLTWELNYLSKEEIDKIPEINIIGKSAYEIWKDLGNEGTEEEFINSLKAIDGQDGKDGQTPIIEVGDNGNWFVNGIDTGAEAKGDKGDKGDPGDTPFIGNNGNWYVSGRDTLMPARGEKGQDGKSAYNIWRSLAPENALKTEDDFINSLRGTNGIDGTTPTIGDNGHWFIGDEDTGIPVRGATGEKGNPGEDGRDGKSAYEIWLSNGNEGTKDDFLGTLKGQDGTTPTIGDNGNWFIDERDTSIRAVAVDGQDGQDGKSAYEIWKDLDESNTKKNEFEFIESLKGETGDKGDSGASGKSAYEIWKELGNEGSEEDFISSLHGKDGTAAVTPSISPSGNWFIGTQDTGILARGTNGKDGESAYEVWKAIEGNEDKTEEDFINSLKGDNGKDGTNGKDGESAYEAWKREGNEGTEEEFIESLRGDQGLSAYEVWRTVEGNENKSKEDYIESLKGDKGDQGLSAYEVWLANGNEGIESDFINYLKGIDGKTPTIGDNGNWFIDGIDTGIQVTGDKGLDGIDGQDGIDGVTPNIGDNGNWFIGDFDTGIPSTGAQGNQGLSAYEVWKNIEGNEDKTEDEYIESLKGEKGDQGEKGSDGKSAYIVWLENGNSGSEEDFIEYLKGKDAQKTAILNMFDELPTSLNVNMSDPSIINRITYFMATSSVTEGKPPIDCMIINLSWYSGYGGTQLGVGMYSNPRMFIRAFNNGSGGWDNKWLEFLTTGNISDTGYIDNPNPPELPVDFRLPYAGTPYSDDVSGIYTDLHSFVKKHKSGFYTVLFGDNWYNVLSLRHRNGYADGENYGLIIYCRMTDLSGDLCWARQAGVDKNETVRILLDSKNYASKIGRINNRILLDRGSYVGTYTGIAGTAGYVNFARIKIIDTYANYPCVFVLGGRGRPIPMFVCVDFASYNGTDPTLAGFYKLLNGDYDVYIYKTATSQWDLYAPKHGQWGRIDILDLWYASDFYEITYPNALVASASSSWIKATTAGIVEIANTLKDCGNGTQIHISYGKTGLAMNNTTWIAGWNNYELRAIHRNYFMQAKNLNGFYGMVVGNYEDNVWVRTTSQGIIPYQSGGRGSGHQELGTDSWYFLKSHIDQMHGVTLDLSGTITSRVNTNTHINGAKGVNVGINMLNAGSGYTILATLKSTNGVFCIGQYQGIFHIYYIANTLINANSNGVTKDLKLLDELGNSEFPGTLNAGALNSRGNISGEAATFNSVTANSGLIKGNLRLQNGNHGQKINFGDSEYVYLYEDIDDHLKIYAKAGAEINCANTYYIKMGIMTVDTNSGYKGTKLYAGSGVSVPNFTPIHDTGCVLGAPSYRWNHIYARDSSISTSDRMEKKEVSYIGKSSDYDTYMDDETLKSFISGLLPVIYKRINGESGRPHHGFIAQDIEKLLQELNIKDHAGFIKSPKTETIEIEEEVEEEYVDEADGQTKTRTVILKREEQREIPDEYIYGLRYEEFIADIVRFVQLQDEELEAVKQKVVEQEEKINKQEEQLLKQQEEINELKVKMEKIEKLLNN